LKRQELKSITVRNLQRGVRVNVAALQRFAERALDASHSQYLRGAGTSDLPSEILVLLISDKRMAGLHQKFLNQSGPTDVITFHHGEIFISVPTARKQASQFATSLARELQLYVAHGLLHLVGFDDHTAADRKRMRAAEQRILDAATV
jgi:probable rRNA maturation factor